MSGIINSAGSRSGVIGPHTFSDTPSFRVYHTAETALTAGTEAAVSFSGVTHNVGSHFSTSTNEFTAPISGYYYINSSLLINTTTTLHRIILYMYKNTTQVSSYQSVHGASAHMSVGAHDIWHMNAGDIAKIAVWSENVSGNIYASSNWSYFSGHLLR